jgi:hypothetical protein
MVSIVTVPQAGLSWVQILVGKNFLSSPKHPDQLGSRSRGSFLGLKQLGHAVIHRYPSVGNVIYECFDSIMAL